MNTIHTNEPTRETKVFRRIVNIAMSAALLLGSLGIPAEAKMKLQNPTRLPVARAQRGVRYQSDTLLVMPAADTDQDELTEALQEVHGKVIASIGEGKLRCLMIKTEKGKLEQTEKALTKGKRFEAISRNYEYRAQQVPNDPKAGEAWQLLALNCFNAWDHAQGGGVKIAVFDTGSQATVDDLKGKTEKGYDARSAMSVLTGNAAAVPPAVLPGTYFDPLSLGINKGLNAAESNDGGNVDKGASGTGESHGTMVATTAAGSSNNSKHAAGIAPKATVFPVRCNSESGVVTDFEIMGGMLNLMGKGIKIINISSGTVPFINFNNELLHMPLHKYFKDYYYNQGGLIFMSQGNDGLFDPHPRLDYLQMVSAVGPVAGDINNVELAKWPGGSGGSSYGNSVTFTAPGVGVGCVDRMNRFVGPSGTSFSSPICAGIAALIWSANPGLSNAQVRNIMIQSCTNSNGLWNPYYGFGMPDAEKAVKIAKGLL